MASLNRVYLMGNLTKDPEIRYLPDGTAVGDLRLAVSETFRNRSTGESVEQTCFVDIVVWRKQAETCGKYLSKGSPILVEGRLLFDEWEAQDGTRRNRLRVRASRVQFLGSPRNAEYRDTEAGSAKEPPRSREPAATAAGDGREAAPELREPEPPGATGATGPESGDDDDLPF